MINESSTGAQGVAVARLLFAGVAKTLDDALRANTADLGSPVESPQRALERVLEEAERRARGGELGRAAFDGLDPGEAARFEDAFAAARSAAEWEGLTLPEPEEFWAAGADRATLARALMVDPTLLPVPTPYWLGASRWVAAFRAAARQPGSPLALAAPLVIAPDVVRSFGELDRVPDGVPAVQTPEGVAWTLRLVPAGAAPPKLGVNHLVAPHVAAPEMLQLQLMRLAASEELVDQQSFTWLAGVFEGERFAARHLYDVGERSVRLNSREIGNQGPHLGARPPVG